MRIRLSGDMCKVIFPSMSSFVVHVLLLEYQHLLIFPDNTIVQQRSCARTDRQTVCAPSAHLRAASLIPQQRGELHQEFLGYTPVAIPLSLFELQHLLLFKEFAFRGCSLLRSPPPAPSCYGSSDCCC
jgi:hypothetical protein